ncbi:hypothetical protein ES707_16862 [subsurface metagenome]
MRPGQRAVDAPERMGKGARRFRYRGWRAMRPGTVDRGSSEPSVLELLSYGQSHSPSAPSPRRDMRPAEGAMDGTSGA